MGRHWCFGNSFDGSLSKQPLITSPVPVPSHFGKVRSHGITDVIYHDTFPEGAFPQVFNFDAWDFHKDMAAKC